MKNIFNAYYQRLCFFAFKILDNKHTAEDIVQDVFTRIMGRPLQFDNEMALKSFLYLSVKNACLNELKKRKIKEQYVKNGSLQAAEEHPKGLNALIKAEVYGEVHQALKCLPAGCGKIVRLSYFDEMKNHEIAQLLNISINTVKTQKKRALQLLRLKLSLGSFLLMIILSYL